MFNDPIQKRFLKADIVSGFFAFDPFVTQDFLPFSEELLVEQGFFEELATVFCGLVHSGKNLVLRVEGQSC